MSEISLQRKTSLLLKSLVNNRVQMVRSAGWKRRVLEQEAKKDVVFQYAGNKAHRSDRIYVWGCSATGALGKYEWNCHVIYFCLYLWITFSEVQALWFPEHQISSVSDWVCAFSPWARWEMEVAKETKFGKQILYFFLWLLWSMNSLALAVLYCL